MESVCFAVNFGRDHYKFITDAVGTIQIDENTCDVKWKLTVIENDKILYNDMFLKTQMDCRPDILDVATTIADYGGFSTYFTHYLVKYGRLIK